MFFKPNHPNKQDMKLRAEKELQKQNGKHESMKAGMRPMAALLSALAIGAVLSEGCTKCPVADSCSTTDYSITLGEGETKDTIAGGAQIHVTVMSISINARVDGVVCRAYGGSAHVKLTIDSDPAFEEEFDVSPSMCYSVSQICTPHVSLDGSIEEEPAEGGAAGAADAGVPSASCQPRCIAFNDTEVTADVELVEDTLYDGENGIPDGGVLIGSCQITNKKVSFTLALGD